MKQSDKKLAELGCYLDGVRSRLRISQDLLCAEIQCSKSTYRIV